MNVAAVFLSASEPLQAYGIDWLFYIGLALTVASVGLSIASLFIDNSASNRQSAQGPRLEDQRITASTYGKPINRLYGTARLAGNIVWTSGIDELATTEFRYEKQGSGGFFGGGVQRTHTNITTYTYYASFIMAVGEGIEPITLLKLFLNAEPVFDATSRNGYGSLGMEVIWYSGRESQRPPVYASKKYPGGITSNMPAEVVYGAELQQYLIDTYPVEATRPVIDVDADTPAYRGLFTLYFRILPLEKYGNRLPIIQAVCSTSPTSDFDQIDYASATDIDYPTYVSWNADRSGFVYIWAGSPSTIAYYQLDGTEIYKKDLRDLAGTGYGVDTFTTGKPIASSYEGYIYVVGGASATTVLKIGIVSGLVEEFLSIPGQAIRGLARVETCTFDRPGDEITNPGTHLTDQHGDQFAVLVAAVFSPGGSYIAAIDPGVGESQGMHLWDSLNVTPGFVLQVIPDGSPIGGFWVLGQSGLGGGSVTLGHYYLSVRSSRIGPEVQLLNLYDLGGDATPISGYVDANDSGIEFNGDASMLRLYEEDDYLIYNGAVLVKWDGAGGIRWIIDEFPDAPGLPLDDFMDWNYFHATALTSNPWLGIKRPYLPIVGDNQEFNFLNTTDATFMEGPAQPLSGWTGLTTIRKETFLYNEVRHSVVVSDANGTNDGPTEIFVGRYIGGTIPVADIVRDQCEWSGMDVDSQLDTTDIDALVTEGFYTSRRSEARSNLTQLMIAYDFGYIETDWKLAFRRVDHAASGDPIEEKYLGVDDDVGKPDTLIPSIRQEADNPLEVVVSYIDSAFDYQPGAQMASRIGEPYPTVGADSSTEIQVAITMKPAEASTLARRALGRVWTHRTKLETVTFPRYIGVDPLDVRTIQGNGISYEVLLGEASIGGGYAISLKGLTNDSAAFAVEGADPEELYTPPTVPVFYGTTLVLLDIPLLQDDDNAGGQFTIYAGVIYSDPDNFPGASAWISSGSTPTFAPWFTASQVVEYGHTLDALGVPTSLFVQDTASSVRIFMQNGVLTGATDHDEFLAGREGVIGLLGKELIQAETVVDNLDGSYTLTNLIRGRRGTEWAVASHRLGERFISLDANAPLIAYRQPLSDLEVPISYRGVTNGQRFQDGLSGTTVFAGNSLRPYAPGGLNGIRLSGRLVVSWVRRSRVSGEVGLEDDDVAELPLAELEERYEAVLLTPDSDITDLSDLSSWGESATVEVFGSEVSVETPMSFTDNGDGTATIARTSGTFDFNLFQVGAYARTSKFGTELTTDGKNTIGMILDKTGDSITVAIAGGGSDLTNPNARVDQLITFAVFTAAEIAEAGYAATDTMKVAVFQISADVGRGFPAADTIG